MVIDRRAEVLIGKFKVKGIGISSEELGKSAEPNVLGLVLV